MSQKRPQIGIQEANSSSRSPSKHEGGDDIRGGQLARSQPYEKLYPSTFRVGLTIFALLIAVLCVALDSTIVSTAIPRITDDFHDLHDVGWYGSGKLHHLLEMICGQPGLIPSQLICSRSVRSSCASERYTELVV